MALNFNYYRPFPFCPPSSSTTPGGTWDYVSDLTLTQAMALYWNLSTLTVTTGGTRTVGSAVAGGSYSHQLLDTLSISSNLFTHGSFYIDSWFPYTSSTALGSWSNKKEPYQRVCFDDHSLYAGKVADYYLYTTGITGDASTLAFELAIGQDSTANKYRLYYRFTFTYQMTVSPDTANIQIINPSNSVTGSVTYNNSGSITLQGHTLSWDSYVDTNSGSTGTISAACYTSDYTY